MSNAAAVRIVAVSTDVLYNTMEDVFITGICRAMTGIRCTPIPGIPLETNASACDVFSGRVINLHYVDAVHRMTLWNFISSETAAKQTCSSDTSTYQAHSSKTPTLYLVVTCAVLFFFLFCFSKCRHKLFFGSSARKMKAVLYRFRKSYGSS